MASLEKEAKTVMLVSNQKEVLGMIAVADELKKMYLQLFVRLNH